MQKVCLQRGLDIPIDGAAQQMISDAGVVSSFAIDPNQFIGLIPKMLVKEGDAVKIGTPLFRDKTFEDIVCTSPVSGVVSKIERGERRKVVSIHIDKTDSDDAINYKENIEAISNGDDVKHILQKSGLWLFIKQRPFACVALPNKTPSSIFISSFDSAPLAPNYNFVLHGKNAFLQLAINMLEKIAPIYVGIQKDGENSEFKNLSNCTLYEVSGPHPAGNVGVQINHIHPLAKGETVWTISVYDLALIGQFFLTGKVNLDRIVALTGPMVCSPKYFKVTPGTPIETITSCNLYKGCPIRLIDNNPISGNIVKPSDTVSYELNQLSAIDEGSTNHEFMGWIMPRFSSFNTHCTDPAKFLDCNLFRYLFGKKHYDWDARLKGGRRPIIVSNEYDKVFPMDIFPEQLIKAMIAGNIDKMEQLGAYEVAPEDFALCEFVCTSKLPLQAIVRQALDNMRKEIE